MDKIFIEIFEELTKLNASGKYTTFFDFLGHVNTVDIRIFNGKWSVGKTPFFDMAVIRFDAPECRSCTTGEHFDPQTFLKYLADLWRFRPTKKHPFLKYSEYDK